METYRQCGKCGLSKPVDAFAYRNKAAKRRQSYCRECHSKIIRIWYALNADRHKANVAARSKKEDSRVRAAVVEAKSKPCSDCGGSYPPWVMDFDHIEGVKLFNIADSHKVPLSAVLAEIAKCQVVCSNCHRQRTHERRRNSTR